MSTGPVIPNPPIRTYRDFIDELVYKLGASPEERQWTQVKSAMRNAYMALVHKRDWRFFWKMSRVFFQLPLTEGTIQYVNSTRTVTWTPVTSTQWPSWLSPYCRLRIGTVNSQIISFSNAGPLTLTLDPVMNPQQDYPAGTPFTVYLNLFPLPGDWRAMGRPRGEVSWWSSSYVTPEEWMSIERAYGGSTGTSIPTAWTIFQDYTPGVYNGFMIATWPWPSTNQTYDYMYNNMARQIVLSGLEATSQTGNSGATVAGSANGKTITGTSTSFGPQHVGAVIRIGNSQKVPTGLEGINPFLEQHVIASVTDSTHAVTVDPLVNTFSGAGFIISDPINLPESMMLALLRRAELELADLKDRGRYPEAEARWRRAYIEAGEADNRMSSPEFASIDSLVVRPPLRYFPYSQPT